MYNDPGHMTNVLGPISNKNGHMAIALDLQPMMWRLGPKAFIMNITNVYG
jgi:hypothetical protein